MSWIIALVSWPGIFASVWIKVSNSNSSSSSNLKVKLDLCPGQKILNNMEIIAWKLSV
jgi:hypothetical protein